MLESSPGAGFGGFVVLLFDGHTKPALKVGAVFFLFSGCTVSETELEKMIQLFRFLFCCFFETAYGLFDLGFW